jgi:hypothetical protein
MTAYIRTPCCRCKRPIGRHRHVEYIDEGTGLMLMWHSGSGGNCCEEFFHLIRCEYYGLMHRLRKKEPA